MTVASPRLARLAQGRAAAPVVDPAGGAAPAPARAPAGAAPVLERCDLCAADLAERHRHLLDVGSRELQCLCRPCALLFDRPAAGADRRRLVPEGVRRPQPRVLDDEAWAGLGIPIGMAFFIRSTDEGRVVAHYPGPAGATESLLGLDAFPEHPAVDALEPDVQALLVNRARGANEEFVVGIDECYRLVGLIRTGWRGFTGGREVWEALGEFFDQIRRQAR